MSNKSKINTLLAIDPGNVQSAYVFVDADLRILEKGLKANDEVLNEIINIKTKHNAGEMAVEMVASYGMPVGATVFETCVWVGRFVEAAVRNGYSYPDIVYRKDVKMHLCQNMRAKDGNIRQALIDRFGVVGTKKNPGWFYGVGKDIWAAYAVAVTSAERR